MMHNPRQYECMRCVRSGKDCSHLDFESMKPSGIYEGVAVIVKCTEFKRREIRG